MRTCLRLRRVTAAIAVLAVIAVVPGGACGFPDYGGFQPGASSASSASSGSGGAGQGGATSTAASSGQGGKGGGAAGGSGGIGGAPECAIDDDCVGNPKGPVCDPTVPQCVACLPNNDVCAPGTYCAPTNDCVAGCNDDQDCNLIVGGTGGAGGGATTGNGGSGGAAPPLTCDTASHTCLGCAIDDQCPPGTLCDVPSTQCLPGCSPQHDCQLGSTCCSGQCANLSTDEANCGACDAVCAPPKGTGQCVAGGCTVTGCDPGFADCDGDPANGCESESATDPANCNGCGMPCAPLANALPGCSGGACTLGPCMPGYADCDGNATTGCETNTLVSVTNCGQCNNLCDLLNANATCQAGVCKVGGCVAGHADCDGASGNGCEVDTQSDTANCGVCGGTCSFPNASASCVGGACQLGACTVPNANCNESSADGCEVNLNSSPGNCGGCGTVCSTPNATPGCSNGSCVVAACNAGYADCNGNPADGCEVQLATNVSNCGACGAACSNNNGAPSCGGGQCSIVCNAGFANCDGSAANGCEINTTNNVNNCNACGNVCPPQGGTPACTNSVCTVTSCAAGKADCDGNSGNGCETTTTNDPNNCGGCGIVCFAQNGYATCSNGTCVVSSCNAGYANCNSQYADGCETNLHTLSNCGACGSVCALPNATASCSTGTCQLVGCTGSFGNCDGNNANGCETNTGTSTSNCGSCGNVCSTNHGSAS